jgi:fructuronate reductase
MDGSQKIPQRWLPVLAFHQERGRMCPAILAGLAAWLRHVRGDGHAVDDPLADRLAQLWRDTGGEGIAAALFGERGLFASHWTAGEESLRLLGRLVAPGGE